MLPVNAIVADYRWSIFRNRATIRLIVVLPWKVDDIQREWLRRGPVHSEVIPVRLAIAAVLVRFAFHGQPEMNVGYLLNLSERAAFEVCVNRRRQQYS